MCQWNATRSGKDDDILEVPKLRFPHGPSTLDIRGYVCRETTDQNVHAVKEVVLELPPSIAPVVRKPKMYLVLLKNPVRVRNTEGIGGKRNFDMQLIHIAVKQVSQTSSQPLA
jgi:hypothetical protein